MPPKLSSKPLWRRIKWGISLIFLTSFFFIALYSFNSYFSVRKIEVFGIDKKFLLVGLDSYKNKNILFLKEKELIETLINQNPQIKNITVTKKIPEKLMIFIELYQPSALIKTNGGYWNLSSDGRILFKSKKRDYSLPFINYYQLINENLFSIGDWLNYKDLIMALNFLSILQEMGLKIDSIDITGYDMIVFKMNKKKIIFTSQKKEEEQRYVLETIIKQFKIEGKDFSSLDLRFNKPIIRFKYD